MPGTIVRVDGLPQLQAALVAAGALAPEALAAGALIEMELMMAEAKGQTPVRDGILRDSGHVLPPEVDATSMEISAGFGGAASAYALVQHERLDFNHTTGNAKFLERPFLAKVPAIVGGMAASLRTALGRLGV